MTADFIPSTDPDKERLLDRYLAGTASETECVRVRGWLSRHPAEAAALDAIVHRLAGAPADDVEVSLKRLRLSLERPMAPERLARTSLPAFGGWPIPRPWVWPSVATLVVGILVLCWTAARHGSARETGATLAYTTGNGERATITLPDGGTVSLNVASRLDVPMDYMMGNHTVRLVGEGLFSVAHHNGTPLTVVAGGTAARVLGTNFVVRRYATDSSTLVAVRDGKVAVGSAVVTAAHLARVGDDGVPHLGSSDASLFTFATGVLTLDGLPLQAAIVELDRWYDTDIRLGDPALAARYAKGKVAAGSLAELVEILELTYDVRVVRDGRVLTLFPR